VGEGVNDSLPVDPCEAYVLAPARWDPPLYGDERNDVPVGGLVFGVTAFPDREVDDYARFLGITSEQLMFRIERAREENRLAAERHRLRYPEPRSRSPRVEYVERPVELLGPMMEARGFKRVSGSSWQYRRGGLTARASMPPADQRRASLDYGLWVGLVLRWGDESRLLVNGDCQDSSFQGRYTVGGDLLRWKCGLCEVTGDLAERAFVVSVGNLMRVFDWIAENHRARLDYLTAQSNRHIQFNLAMRARRENP
jgi:hypothetical protein